MMQYLRTHSNLVLISLVAITTFTAVLSSKYLEAEKANTTYAERQQSPRHYQLNSFMGVAGKDVAASNGTSKSKENSKTDVTVALDKRSSPASRKQPVARSAKPEADRHIRDLSDTAPDTAGSDAITRTAPAANVTHRPESGRLFTTRLAAPQKFTQETFNTANRGDNLQPGLATGTEKPVELAALGPEIRDTATGSPADDKALLETTGEEHWPTPDCPPSLPADSSEYELEILQAQHGCSYLHYCRLSNDGENILVCWYGFRSGPVLEG